MSHLLQLSLSDEAYTILQALAAQRGKAPEQLIESLVDEAWEAECAKYDTLFEQDPDWQESARKASEDAQAGRHSDTYHTTEEFFRLLGASKERMERLRQKEQGGENANS